MSFKDKVILITGAGSGIGAACANHFATEGALLSLVDLDADNLQEMAKEMREIGFKVEPLLILGNVNTDSEHVVNQTINKFGRLDVLINNAGIAKIAFLENTTEADYDKIMSTNVRSCFFLTQLAVPHLLKTKGNIVNVSSVLSMIPYPNSIAYCMSKAAVNQFTRCAALELAEKGVRVNAVCPGFVLTKMNKCFSGESEVNTYIKKHPIGRIAEAREIANAIAFLANENSGFITGVTFTVDGGLQLTSA